MNTREAKKQAKWRELVESFKTSGQEIGAYCQNRGIKVELLKKWDWRLRAEAKGYASSKANKVCQVPHSLNS